MKKTTQKIAALIAAFSLTFPVCSFADDAAPEPAARVETAPEKIEVKLLTDDSDETAGL